MFSRTRRLSIFNICVLVCVIVVLYLPLTIVVLYSFNDSSVITEWSGMSLRWYKQFIQRTHLLWAIWTSFKIAIVSSCIATVLGVILGTLLYKIRSPKSHCLVTLLACFPVVAPEVIIGFAFFQVFVLLSMDRGFITLILTHSSVAACYVAFIIESRLQGFDLSLENAAINLGCTPFSAFIKVMLPNMVCSIFFSFCLSFIISLDDVVMASFNNGDVITLPIVIYSTIKLGVTPIVNVLSAILLLLILLLTGVIFTVYKVYGINGRRESQ